MSPHSNSAGDDTVHIVMSADSVIRRDFPLTPETPLKMAIVPKNDFRLLPANADQSARAVTHDPAHQEPALPSSRHYGTVIGTFSRSQLCADCFVVLYRIHQREPSGRTVNAAWARITAADLAVLR